VGHPVTGGHNYRELVLQIRNGADNLTLQEVIVEKFIEVKA
jgi:hypothetical protein